MDPLVMLGRKRRSMPCLWAMTSPPQLPGRQNPSTVLLTWETGKGSGALSRLVPRMRMYQEKRHHLSTQKCWGPRLLRMQVPHFRAGLPARLNMPNYLFQYPASAPAPSLDNALHRPHPLGAPRHLPSQLIPLPRHRRKRIPAAQCHSIVRSRMLDTRVLSNYRGIKQTLADTPRRIQQAGVRGSTARCS